MWEAHKAFFKGKFILEGSRLKRDAPAQKTSLLTKLCSAERCLVCSLVVARFCAVTFQRDQLKSITKSTTTNSLPWTKQKFYEYFNKLYRMLVSKLNPHPFHSFPDFLLQPNGAPTLCPQSMARVFGDFYSKLYNCLTPTHHSPFNQETFDSLLADIYLPKLSSSDLQKLNSPITMEELSSTIKLFSTHKSPGPGRLPYTYFKTYMHVLAPHMLSLFNLLLEGMVPHPSFTHSFISLIPKLGKDPIDR